MMVLVGRPKEKVICTVSSVYDQPHKTMIHVLSQNEHPCGIGCGYNSWVNAPLDEGAGIDDATVSAESRY